MCMPVNWQGALGVKRGRTLRDADHYLLTHIRVRLVKTRARAAAPSLGR